MRLAPAVGHVVSSLQSLGGWDGGGSGSCQQLPRPAYDLGLEGQIDPTVAVRSVVFALCWLLGQVPLQSISLHAKRLLREILGSFDRYPNAAR